MIHIGNRDKMDNTGLNYKYLAIIFISALSMLLISIYFYMGYTVTRLRQAYIKYGLLEVADMKDEPLRGLLADKSTKNLFQCHFNLFLMLKDVWICSLLLMVYERVFLLLWLLTAYQLIFLVLTIVYPPYLTKGSNRLLWITQSMYLMLDIAFLINVGLSMTEEVRYFYVGISMITIVAVIILVNSGSSTYNNFIIIVEKCKRRWKKKIQPQPTVSLIGTGQVRVKIEENLSPPSNKPTNETAAVKPEDLHAGNSNTQAPPKSQPKGAHVEDPINSSQSGLVDKDQLQVKRIKALKAKKKIGSILQPRVITRQKNTVPEKRVISKDEGTTHHVEVPLEDVSSLGITATSPIENERNTKGARNTVSKNTRSPKTRIIQVLKQADRKHPQKLVRLSPS